MQKSVPIYVKALRENDVDRVLIPDSNNPVASSVLAKEKTKLQTQIENIISSLNDYYLKTETYSKEEVNALFEQLAGLGIEFKEVQNLPTTGENKYIYLVPKTGSTNDIYDEYIWINGKFERIGSTAINLANYYTKTETDAKLATKGGLSSANTWSGANNFTGGLQTNGVDVATTTQVNQKITMPTALEGGYLKYTQAKGAHWALVESSGSSNASKDIYLVNKDLGLGYGGYQIDALNELLGITENLKVGNMLVDTAGNMYRVSQVSSTEYSLSLVNGGASGKVIYFLSTEITNPSNFPQATISWKYPTNSYIMDKTGKVYKVAKYIPDTTFPDILVGSYELTLICNPSTGGSSGGSGGSVIVDSELSETSVNPVQNKVVAAEFAKKLTIPEVPMVEALKVGDSFNALKFETSLDIDEYLKGLTYDGEIFNETTGETYTTKMIVGVYVDMIGSNLDIIFAFIKENGIDGQPMYAVMSAAFEPIYTSKNFVLDDTFTKKGWYMSEFDPSQGSFGELINMGMLTLPFTASVVAENQNFISDASKKSGSSLLERDENGNYRWLTKQALEDSTEQIVLKNMPIVEVEWDGQNGSTAQVRENSSLLMTGKAKVHLINTSIEDSTDAIILTPISKFGNDGFTTIWEYEGILDGNYARLDYYKLQASIFGDTTVYVTQIPIKLFRHDIATKVEVETDDGSFLNIDFRTTEYSHSHLAKSKDEILKPKARDGWSVSGNIQKRDSTGGSTIYPIAYISYNLQSKFEVWYYANNSIESVDIFLKLNSLTFTDVVTEV